MDKKENKKQKKPLKLSSAGRLQIRRNLGPSTSANKNQASKGKTIQIVFRNKNNQQKSSSTTKSTQRGSSSFRPQQSSNFIPASNFTPKFNKNFQQKNKKNNDLKKNQARRTTLKPLTDDTGKLNVSLIFKLRRTPPLSTN